MDRKVLEVRLWSALVPIMLFTLLIGGARQLKKQYVTEFDVRTQVTVHQAYNVLLAIGAVVVTRLAIRRFEPDSTLRSRKLLRIQYGMDMFGAGYAGFHIGAYWIMMKSLAMRPDIP